MCQQIISTTILKNIYKLTSCRRRLLILRGHRLNGLNFVIIVTGGCEHFPKFIHIHFGRAHIFVNM